MPTLTEKSTSTWNESFQNQNEEVQVWSDGSVYNGCFKNGCRHGRGKETWPNGEVYIGDFVNDKKEGSGVYDWPDGSKFVGYFKADKRCGYGRHDYKNGSFFEGIYQNDVRDGPGIFTYTDTEVQDVGIWLNEKIYKICTKLKCSFTYEQYSEHAINAATRDATSPDKGTMEDKDLDKQKPLWQVDQDLIGTIPTTFDYEDIIGCSRQSFKPKGHLERLSEKLIQMAVEGDVLSIAEILRRSEIHPDVTDATGFSAMLAAAVNCHRDVLNCLLDFGANVNILNSEGLSPLAACYVLQYTKQDFIDNIAENMPKENTFNSIEWDKQRGSILHRNDRKAILSMYGTSRSQSNEFNKARNGCNVSSKSQRGSGLNGEPAVFETSLNDEENDNWNAVESWKLTYYQRTLSRREKLDEISRNFSKLRGRPHDFEANLEEADPAPLPALAAERIAQEAEKKGTVPSQKMQLSEASVYCGESSFGHAPKVGISIEDMKQSLLNAERKPHLKSTIALLLERGADPNASSLPLPVLFFAVKAADIKACEALLAKGADTSIRLDEKNLGLAPLHIAVALPCHEGIEISRLLLEAKANPDLQDLAFGKSSNGRTALHIVCTREDDNKTAQKVASYLLQHNANPNILCQGHSPLSLAISSGNDFIVEALLKHNADPSLKLTNGVGSALCSATTFTAERRRQPSDRVRLIDQLVKAGADLLAPINIAEKYLVGTVVDYAHHVFNQDRRIAHTPYHALNALERACHNTRKEVLDHLGNLLRTAALRREKQMIEAELQSIAEAEGRKTTEVEVHGQSDDATTNGQLKSSSSKRTTLKECSSSNSERRSPKRDPSYGLPFAVVKFNDPKTIAALETNAANQRRLEAKRRFRYCYECGRSLGVRLAGCTRCKEVFFCSKVCKVKAWNLRHKEECARVSGRRSKQTGNDRGRSLVSPTPTTDVDDSLTNQTSKKTEEFGSARSGKSQGKRKTKNASLPSTGILSAKSPPSSNTRSVRIRHGGYLGSDMKHSTNSKISAANS